LARGLEAITNLLERPNAQPVPPGPMHLKWAAMESGLLIL